MFCVRFTCSVDVFHWSVSRIDVIGPVEFPERDNKVELNELSTGLRLSVQGTNEASKANDDETEKLQVKIALETIKDRYGDNNDREWFKPTPTFQV